MYDQHPLLQNQRIHSTDGRLDAPSSRMHRPVARPGLGTVISVFAAVVLLAGTAGGLMS